MRLFYTCILSLTSMIGMSVYANTTTASYYADKFNGRKTANGEVFSNKGMTCASNQYKLGTYVEVTNVKTGKSITCKVNDRIGKAGRIDLTQNAFKQLAPLSAGLVKVKVTPVGAKPAKEAKVTDSMLAKEKLDKDTKKQADDKASQDSVVNLALKTE
ncbi:MAG: septal ring lytic transglycosylase RlpA family protein [Moraxella sp.]|uniref:septal ring lytic transglycosylase RlpA family protein n=1 Tax=Moraxella sp. TaxID=479 RepID=UPI0026DC5CC2|nr:septal ring lytic transglycosylase RlpA family protein [Moraxella sp.]MDO4449887.1 septal ring lytic transglycosylase RlpA family protein [Moraxella sp.]